MAKPIRATPELHGEEARKFVQLMFRREKAKMTKRDLELAKSIEKWF